MPQNTERQINELYEISKKVISQLLRTSMNPNLLNVFDICNFRKRWKWKKTSKHSYSMKWRGTLRDWTIAWFDWFAWHKPYLTNILVNVSAHGVHSIESLVPSRNDPLWGWIYSIEPISVITVARVTVTQPKSGRKTIIKAGSDNLVASD